MPSPCKAGYNTYLIGFPSDFAKKQIANMTIIILIMSFADIIFTKKEKQKAGILNIFNIPSYTIKFSSLHL